MYDIIGRVIENVLPDAGTFIVNKITSIGDSLRDNSRFVVEKEREPGMLGFSQISKSYVQKIIGEKQGHKL